MMNMKVIFSRQQKSFPAPKNREMGRMLEKACSLCGLLKDNPGFRLAVNFVDTDTICRINREFVGHEGTTDVISFNYGLEDDLCTDVADAELFICTDTAKSVADRLKGTFSDEVVLYLVHGILHVSGEDDGTATERRRMRSLERKIICELRKFFDFGEIFPERSK